MGEMTPVLAMDHLRLREASHFTTRAAAGPECPGSDAALAPGAALGVRGGKSLATQRSPWGRHENKHHRENPGGEGRLANSR